MSMDRRHDKQDVITDSYGEAEYWFARLLNASCAADVRAEFERWRAGDPAHALAFRDVERLWQQSGDAVRDHAVMAAAHRALHGKPAFRARARWFFPALAAGFAVLVAAIMMPRWLATPADPLGITYVTQPGQSQSVQLTDGSSILLDTDTEIVVRYNAHTRRVNLLRGQAQFTVQGNHAWPFVVYAEQGTVTAVGTQFQVRVHDDITDVALLKGKLAITDAASDGIVQDASLIGGQSLAFDDRGRITTVQPIDLQRAQGWTEGKLFIHDWRLADVLAELNRYSATKLQLADPSLGDIRISGVFRTNDQQTLLLLLQQGWPIHAQRVSATRIDLVRKL